MKRFQRDLLVHELPYTGIPVQTFQAISEEPYSFLLDSGVDPVRLGRYSFLGTAPFLIFTSKGKEIQIRCGRRVERKRGNPFLTLKALLNRYQLQPHPNFPPFLNGAVGYFSYDLCHFIERLPHTAKDDLALPDCCLGFYDVVLAHDHLKGKTYIASSGLPETERGAARLRARRRMEEMLSRLEAAQNFARNPAAQPQTSRPKQLISNFTRESYLAAVKRAKEYIAQGDICQVNLSQRFSAALEMPPFELYKKLREINPAPFAAFVNYAPLIVVGASPERFLKIQGDRAETRPIKGTRPRGSDPIADAGLAHELRESPKDAAEHLMIVDLERNDLGRVCQYGSVKVSEFAALEKYATVFHLVSTIEGRLRADVDAIDCLMACFPGGSITGTPKVRAMEIIDELEPTSRSLYTGALGYLSFDGSVDLNIVIRTLLLTRGMAHFQVGGGIVADSTPEEEYEETMDKARALLAALGQGQAAWITTHSSPISSYVEVTS